MIMKIKSSVLFGLIVVIFSVSGFSLLKRLTRDVDEWRPSDLYSTTNVTRRSTYSVVSSGSSASYSGAVPSVSSGSSSMFRHRAVPSYAPAGGFAYSQSPLASSPLASSPQGGLYTTSSAEFRSFGGGGNAGGVSMSGGAIKSSGSSMSAPSSALSVSMPAAPAFAYNRGAMSSVAGDMAMASDQAYAGIGNTTGSRGMRGRRNIGENTGNSYDSWLAWFDRVGWSYGTNTGNDTYTYSDAQARAAYDAWVASLSDQMPVPSFEVWLQWFLGGNGSHYSENSGNTYTYSALPIGDVFPLFVFVVLYLLYLLCSKRKVWQFSSSKMSK
jgi:hypothetical protein